MRCFMIAFSAVNKRTDEKKFGLTPIWANSLDEAKRKSRNHRDKIFPLNEVWTKRTYKIFPVTNQPNQYVLILGHMNLRTGNLETVAKIVTVASKSKVWNLVNMWGDIYYRNHRGHQPLGGTYHAVPTEP